MYVRERAEVIEDLNGNMSKEDLKTRQMEKSYHLLFKQIADHCVAHGIPMKLVVERMNQYQMDVDAQSVKNTWKTILKSKTGKTSTTEQTKEDVKIVQEEFGRLWGEITGETFDWPAIETQMRNQLDNDKYFS